MNPKPIIFNFWDYREFLNQWFNYKKKLGRGHSLETFSIRSGVSKVTLSLVLHGKRNLSANSIPKIIKGIGIKKDEATFFRLLVLYNQLEDQEERGKKIDQDLKIEYLLSLENIKAQNDPLHRMEYDQFSLMSKWYILAIWELIDTKKFSKNPGVISRYFRDSISKEQVIETLEILENLGLIEKDPKKGHKKTVSSVLVPKKEKAKLANFKLTGDLLEMARKNFYELPIQAKKDFSSLIFSIRQEDADEIIYEISKFIKKINKLSEVKKNKDQVCQLSISFYPLTK